MDIYASLCRNTNRVTLTETEIQLYDLCEQGDRKSQMAVYDQYCKGMYHVALRIVQDEGEAEDIMQESMITAFQKMSQWNRRATFGAWLKRIVVNNSLNHLRKHRKMQKVDYDSVSYEMEAVPDQQIDMESAGMTAKKVLEIMKAMNDRYREVLTLSLIEGMDNEEISEILGISNGACRTTISRAKDSLRQKLQAI
ncbi:RNA polymerase sigma factor [Nonlabens spongiae]|uniref:RNA polymerase sigma factor n=1 Tax=Nonlabens spongiae TaxID=331648 RepID=UPI0012F4A947|nr:sigma-70 family RNA polymerase sigma factor [Nonlabens spongiae]